MEVIGITESFWQWLKRAWGITEQPKTLKQTQGERAGEQILLGMIMLSAGIGGVVLLGLPKPIIWQLAWAIFEGFLFCGGLLLLLHGMYLIDQIFSKVGGDCSEN